MSLQTEESPLMTKSRIGHHLHMGIPGYAKELLPHDVNRLIRLADALDTLAARVDRQFDAILQDKNTSQAGKVAAMQKLRSDIAQDPLWQRERAALRTGGDTIEGRINTELHERRGKVVEPWRDSAIVQHFLAMPVEKRGMTYLQALDNGDAETARAIEDAPAVLGILDPRIRTMGLEARRKAVLAQHPEFVSSLESNRAAESFINLAERQIDAKLGESGFIPHGGVGAQ